jgi:hypothetical protein
VSTPKQGFAPTPKENLPKDHPTDSQTSVAKGNVEKAKAIAEAAARDRARVEAASKAFLPEGGQLTAHQVIERVREEVKSKDDIDKLRAAQIWLDSVGEEIQKKIKEVLAIETDAKIGFKVNTNHKGKHRASLVAQWREKDKVRAKVVQNEKELIGKNQK